MNNRENDLKLGLTLSGGGFRATLFHLGVVAYLRDANLLENLKHVCCVSGGSVLGAHLAKEWKNYSSRDDDQFQKSVLELVDFIKSDVRGTIARRAPIRVFTYFFPKQWTLYRFKLLNKLLNYLFTKKTKSQQLVNIYNKRLYKDFKLSDASPGCPEIHLLALCINNVKLWSFSQKGIEVGLGGRDEVLTDTIGVQEFPVALPVAASSAFTAYFEPVEINSVTDFGLSVESSRLKLGQEVSELTDGGVFDNLGAEKLDAICRTLDVQERPDFCIFSDAAGTLDFAESPSGPFSFLVIGWRAVNILMERIQQLIIDRVFASGQSNEGSLNCNKNLFVCLKHVFELDSYDAKNMSIPQAQRKLSQIRTDLDAFSEVEVSGLYRHGYQVAKYIVEERASHDPKLNVQVAESNWEPSSINRPLNAEESRDLTRSRSLNLVGFIWSPTDWFGWINATVIVSILGLLIFALSMLLRNSDLLPFDPGENHSANTLFQMISKQVETLNEKRKYNITITYDDKIYERFKDHLVNFKTDEGDLLWKDWANEFADVIETSEKITVDTLVSRLGRSRLKYEDLNKFITQLQATANLDVTSGTISVNPTTLNETTMFGSGEWNVGNNPKYNRQVMFHAHKNRHDNDFSAMWIQARYDDQVEIDGQLYYEFFCNNLQVEFLNGGASLPKMASDDLFLNLNGNEYTNDGKLKVGKIEMTLVEEPQSGESNN